MPTYTSNTDNGYVLTLIVNEQSQNVENNQTVLSYQLNLSSGSAAYMTSITSQANITMDGSSIFSMNQQISIPNFNTTIILTSGTRTITHNADGTKSVPLSAWFETNNKYSYTPSGRLSLSGTMVLTTIPRASQPTLNVSSQNLGSVITISTNRASTAFTHTLKYTFGSLSATIATGVAISQAWTLPTSLGGQIPNTTSGTGSIICETYNGGTLIGTRTVSFTATVPNNTTFQPTVPVLTVTDAATRPTGITSYVQTKARIRVQSSSTAQAGASISQYRVTILGTNYTGSDITTGVINTSGSVSILVRATDSRGYFREQTTSVTVVAYSPPQLTKSIATRSPNDQGTDLSTTISYSISPINNQNTKQYRIRYKRADLSTWTQLVSSTTSYALTDQANSATGVLSGDNSWNIEFMVKDSYAEIITIVNVGTAFELINFNASGKGIAFGKVSEGDDFDVALPPKFRLAIEAIMGIAFRDTRSVSDTPSDLPAKAISFDFKLRTSVGNPPLSASANSTYAHIMTIAGWSTGEGSGGWPMQLSIGSGGMAIRQATSATTWGAWTMVGGASPLDMYPIGAIYMSVVNTSPATLFGGTWAVFGTGRTLVGIDIGQTEFNSIEKTGGAKTHTLTVSEMPSHTHTQNSHNHTQNSHNHTQNAHSHGQHDSTWMNISPSVRMPSSGSFHASIASAVGGVDTKATTATNVATTATNVATTATNQNTGGGAAHNNIQPYITVYMWKRTA